MELKDLKPGDKVVEFGGGPMASNTIETISRITATQIIIGGHREARYNRISGNRVGSSGWSRRYIRPAKKEDIQTIEEREARLKLVLFIDDKISNLRKWPTKYLIELKDIVERMGKEGEAGK
jgi:hypothetical protein